MAHGKRTSIVTTTTEYSDDVMNQFANTEVIGIMSINAEGKILYSNTKAQEIFQFPVLTGASIHEFVPDNYFGSNNFKEKHRQMVSSFFSRPFAGGRMLDPGTILRAKLKSGQLKPLNIGLESKLDPKTGKPAAVIAYLTEAALIIEQSKVEKMLARATLVVLQQFISQTIVSAVSAVELDNIPSLHYGSVKDEATKLEICLKYSFNKLSTEDKGGQDYKMLLYILSTALTIAISVLPLFVNHMHDHDTDEDKNKKSSWSRSEIIKKSANQINDLQEYLSTVKTFRELDIIFLTIFVTLVNLFLLYKLRTLPDEFGITSLKECEQTIYSEKKISLVITILGMIPASYLLFKECFIYIEKYILSVKNRHNQIEPEPSSPQPISLSNRKSFQSFRDLEMFPEGSMEEDEVMKHEASKGIKEGGGCPFHQNNQNNQNLIISSVSHITDDDI